MRLLCPLLLSGLVGLAPASPDRDSIQPAASRPDNANTFGDIKIARLQKGVTWMICSARTPDGEQTRVTFKYTNEAKTASIVGPVSINTSPGWPVQVHEELPPSAGTVEISDGPEITLRVRSDRGGSLVWRHKFGPNDTDEANVHWPLGWDGPVFDLTLTGSRSVANNLPSGAKGECVWMVDPPISED